MEAYKCIPSDRIITKTNKSNHENTELHINNSERNQRFLRNAVPRSEDASLNKDNPSYKICVSCKRLLLLLDSQYRDFKILLFHRKSIIC
jgi:hypothetical protein